MSSPRVSRSRARARKRVTASSSGISRLGRPELSSGRRQSFRHKLDHSDEELSDEFGSRSGWAGQTFEPKLRRRLSFRRTVHRGIGFATLEGRVMRSHSTRLHHLRHTGSIGPSPHLPLSRLALCLDCETCFDAGTPSCPGCGGGTSVLLARFLNQGPLKTLSQFQPLPRSWAKGSKPHEDASAPAIKQLLIVARDRQTLYEHVKRTFSDNPSVEVILDRRSAESRTTTRASAPERRRGDKDLRLETDYHLRAFGWAIVRLNVLRTVGPPRGSTSL